MLNRFRISALAAAMVGGFAISASASDVYINTGVDANVPPLVVANGSTTTSAFQEFGYTGTLATSVYFGNPNTPGTVVLDTNRNGLLGGFGIPTGPVTAIDGVTALNFTLPLNPAQINISGLNNAPDLNGFTDGLIIPYGFGGLTGFWGLTYLYSLNGVTVDSDANGVSDSVLFNSGTFEVFYESGDANDGKTVLKLQVVSSLTQLNNLTVTGIVDYTGVADPFVQNFVNDAATGKSLYSSWLNGPTSVKWILDTNVNPPIPTADQLWDSTSLAGPGPFIRQTTLDGSVRLDVPEPGSIALVGLALAGLGMVRRRRNQQA